MEEKKEADLLLEGHAEGEVDDPLLVAFLGIGIHGDIHAQGTDGEEVLKADPDPVAEAAEVLVEGILHDIVQAFVGGQTLLDAGLVGCDVADVDEERARQVALEAVPELDGADVAGQSSGGVALEVLRPELVFLEAADVVLPPVEEAFRDRDGCVLLRRIEKPRVPPECENGVFAEGEEGAGGDGEADEGDIATQQGVGELEGDGSFLPL